MTLPNNHFNGTVVLIKCVENVLTNNSSNVSKLILFDA